jgi:transaldolase
MKLFIDSADVKEIFQCLETGFVDGVTTNPTLIHKSGRQADDVYRELIGMGAKDISMEVVGTQTQMIREAHRLVELFGVDATTIKVPCTPDGLEVCRYLSEEGTKVNVTLIFSAAQAILAAKAGAKYASVFVGRCDDNSVAGLEVVRSVAELYARQGVSTEVLSASIRDVYKVTRSFYNGANIVTMPPSIFHKMYIHVLTDDGMRRFNRDAGLPENTGL